MPLSIRMPEHLMARLDTAVASTGLSKNDIIKLALDIGLRILEDNGYDLTKGIPTREMEDMLKRTVLELLGDAPPDIDSRLAAKGVLPGTAVTPQPTSSYRRIPPHPRSSLNEEER